MPLVIKVLLVITTFILLSFLVLKIFKPLYLEKIYKKSVSYFFHYLHLDNHQFDEINISGNVHVTEEQILEIVASTKENLAKKLTKNEVENYQPLIGSLVNEIKSQLPWVNQVTITRSMPNMLNISIIEYVPIAIWQENGTKYLTDKEGNLVPFEEAEEFKNMVILSGKGANTNAKSLFNIFTADSNLSANVYSATWVANRRWDIRFENGLLIKLPENNISEAWRRLIKIYNMPGSILGLKIIDLRVPDKVYLEYDDSVIKELKTL